MVILDEAITLHKIFTLGDEEMYEIYHGWISDESKMQKIAASDGRPINQIIRDAITGMAGEWGAYHYITSHNFPCQKPQCGVLSRDVGVWDKDLTLLNPLPITTANNQINAVEKSISCKAQLFSQTDRIHDLAPSWTFQLETNDRNGDPILQELGCNKLLVVSWIDDYWNGRKIYYTNPRGAYKTGFRLRPQVTCFWWPDVSRFLRDPKNKNLIGKKTCLYFEDIKHLQSRIIQMTYGKAK